MLSIDIVTKLKKTPDSVRANFVACSEKLPTVRSQVFRSESLRTDLLLTLGLWGYGIRSKFGIGQTSYTKGEGAR